MMRILLTKTAAVAMMPMTLHHAGASIPFACLQKQVNIKSAIPKESLPKSVKEMTKATRFMFALQIDDQGHFSFAQKMVAFLRQADCAFVLTGAGHRYRCFADRKTIVSEAGGKAFTVVPVHLAAGESVKPGTYRVTAANQTFSFKWLTEAPLKLVVSHPVNSYALASNCRSRTVVARKLMTSAF